MRKKNTKATVQTAVWEHDGGLESVAEATGFNLARLLAPFGHKAYRAALAAIWAAGAGVVDKQKHPEEFKQAKAVYKGLLDDTPDLDLLDLTQTVREMAHAFDGADMAVRIVQTALSCEPDFSRSPERTK